MRSSIGRGLQFALLWVVAWSLSAEAATRDNIRTRGPETPSKILCQTFKIGCVKKSSGAKKKKVATRKSKPAAVAPEKVAAADKSTAPERNTATEKAIAPERKAPLPSAAPPVPPKVARADPQGTVPIPKPKPQVAALAPPASATAAPTLPSAKVEPSPARDPLAEQGLATEADTACRDALRALGVTFTVPDSVEGKGQCNVPNPVQLTSLAAATGEVKLPGHPLLNCRFAQRFSTWLADVAVPVVGTGVGQPLAAVSTGPGYECRGRNGDSSAKISEHAFGNAIDIDGLVLSGGTRLEIADVADSQHRFHRVLSALRESGCGYFTTVLGPGSNAAHASHYHFDLGRHGKSERTRICE